MNEANKVVMRDNKKLTPKQLLFCKEYIIDFNASRSAIAAGYNKKTARQTGYELLTKHYIQKYIQKEIVKREKRTERSADEVIKRLWEFSDIDAKKYGKKANTKATELLAKHYGLLIEKHEHTGGDGGLISVAVKVLKGMKE